MLLSIAPADLSPLAPLAPVLGLPVKTLGVNAYFALLHGFVLGVDLFMGQRDDVLPFVVVDQVQVLECGDHILLLDAGHLRNLTERKSRTI